MHVNDEIEGAVYIGRAVPRRKIRCSVWSNPYRVGRNPILQGRELTRDQVLAKYREAVTVDTDEAPLTYLLERLDELTGKPLACWCRHDGDEPTDDNRCHGDVIIEIMLERGIPLETVDDDQ